MPDAIALFADSYSDSNMYYATRFVAPDPFVFVKAGGRRTIVVSDLEYGRAREGAQVDEVIRMPLIEKKIKPATPSAIIAHLLETAGSRTVTVPADFPLRVADELRKAGIQVTAKAGVFFESRAVKTEEEVWHIEGALRATEAGHATAEQVLRDSKIEGDRIVFEGETLTSEILRGRINATLAGRNCIPSHTIVAGGDQGCDPHETGTGPLRPHQTIIVDIFPRSIDTLYWGDMTRTFLKGRANPEQKKLYETVMDGQQLGFDQVRDGADGKAVHAAILKLFEARGYRTEERSGKMNGFFHGTGHGLGLDIHESPRIAPRGATLKSGNVVTVEPGLYYFGLGGVRIEDVVLVEDRDCRVLSEYPKSLVIE